MLFGKFKKTILVLVLLGLVFPGSGGGAEADSANAADWYQRAAADLETAALVFENTPHYHQVCFMAHQAVEKSIKGALFASGKQPKKSHRTVILLRDLLKTRPELKPFLKPLRSLDRIYITSRYPTEGASFSEEDGRGCLEHSMQFVQAIDQA